MFGATTPSESLVARPQLTGRRLRGVAAGGNDGPMERIRALLWEIARALKAGGARDEALAVHRPPHTVLGIPRPATLKPVGRVWRLGVFLLGEEAALFATGRITRAVPPGHPGHVAVSAEERREIRAAAYRGRFVPGEAINYDANPIELSLLALQEGSGPLFLAGDRALVRWSASVAGDEAADLEPYLRERADLLLHPPQGAT